MSLNYRITFEVFDSKQKTSLTKQIMKEGSISKPTNCFDFAFGHDEQIEIIQNCQDELIKLKCSMLNQESKCPTCEGKMRKFGSHKSSFSDVFTDHKITIPRIKCKECKYEAPSTVRGIIGGNLSATLQKIQAQLGAKYTYRNCEETLKLFSTSKRSVNNHERVKRVTESVGNTLEKINNIEQEIVGKEHAKELVLSIDGGHIKTIEEGRSIEAMTSVVYKPESLVVSQKGDNNYLLAKSCAASAKTDNQEQIIRDTIIACLRQGMSENTHITTLCDGAKNCWNIADGIKPFCKEITYILDWFHIAMKIKNISLPEQSKERLIKIKWHLWRGRADYALLRLQQLIELLDTEKDINKIIKFKKYIENNKEKIVNYRARKKQNFVFTSNLAESTVESLINDRCKGHQHMRWSREGVNPVLQIRAAINSNFGWEDKWKTAVLNAPNHKTIH